MPRNGREIPYYNDKGMPVGFFFYDSASEVAALSAAKSTADAFYSIIGIVAVDM